MQSPRPSHTAFTTAAGSSIFFGIPQMVTASTLIARMRPCRSTMSPRRGIRVRVRSFWALASATMASCWYTCSQTSRASMATAQTASRAAANRTRPRIVCCHAFGLASFMVVYSA